jgi:LytS/YehU family sensor histidine kinase
MLITRQLAYLLISGEFMEEWNLVDRYLYEFPKTLGIYIGFGFITYTKIYYDSAQQEQLNAAKLHSELQEIRMQTLRNQLQPHFLFNTLNLISSTTYQDPDKADSIITRLGDLLRYSLATEQKPFVTLKEEVHAMSSYLEISELRFGEKMSIDIRIEPQTELLLIPAMLLQPLLENAVKYGIEPSDSHGVIALHSQLVDGHLIIQITNPWHQRRQQQESFGVGLQNAKNRLNLLYQDEASILLESENTQQVTLTITLPAQKMEYTHAI